MTNNKQYVCVMFPYPSGEGLHLGHVYNYAIADSYCRYLNFVGMETFQPFGYDSFGLPAENYARSIGGDAKDVTYKNIAFFRKQMERMYTRFEELIITSDPSYQKWTQWLFLKLRERGLAYQKYGEVNWCNSCCTVLANEQVEDERCNRCGTKIQMKELNQWYFKITTYKDRLIKNLDTLDYPEGTILQQRRWLENLRDWCVSRQRSWGCRVPLEGETDTLDTFVDSSFYYIRYCDPENQQELCSKEKYRQVDLYIGGREHACMHLIYARFINMFLYDEGIVSQEEPFKKVIHQGMILKDGEKMAKSKGNVVSPDLYDPDALRFYLMFLGHYFDGGDWNDQHIKGVVKFINRMKVWLSREGTDEIDFLSFQTKILQFSASFKFNKVVSEFMTFLNANKNKSIDKVSSERIISLLKIYMPGFNVNSTSN